MLSFLKNLSHWSAKPPSGLPTPIPVPSAIISPPTPPYPEARVILWKYNLINIPNLLQTLQRAPASLRVRSRVSTTVHGALCDTTPTPRCFSSHSSLCSLRSSLCVLPQTCWTCSYFRVLAPTPASLWSLPPASFSVSARKQSRMEPFPHHSI